MASTGRTIAQSLPQQTGSLRLAKLRLDLLTYTLLTLVGVTIMFPFVWMLATSIKPDYEVLSTVTRLYTLHPTIEQYRKLLTVSNFSRFYANSIFVSGVVTVGQALTSSLAGFAFARLTFPGRDKLLAGYVATMMVPFAVRLVPLFVIMRGLHWVDTYMALTIPLICSPYFTFLFRQFYRTIPQDLTDAATLDGCSSAGLYRHIMLPLSQNMMAAVGVLGFLGSWKAFMWPLIVTNSKDLMVISVALSRLVDELVMDWGLLMAAASIAMIPTLLIFILAQEQFVKSITLTGIKG